MSRYLNFYFNPWHASQPGNRFTFKELLLHESDCCEVPWCKEPHSGGIGSDEGGQDGVIAVIFDASTTPPTLVRDAHGTGFCSSFGHRDYPKTYIYEGKIFAVNWPGLPQMIMEGPV